MKKFFIFAVCAVLLSVTTLQVYAQDSYSARTFGFFTGDYSTKNGSILISGLYKFGNSDLGKMIGIGQLKYWDMVDTSIPNCKHAFANDFTIIFENGDYAQQTDLISGRHLMVT